jgi:hypothetical protein
MWQNEVSASQNASAQWVGDNFGGLLLIGSAQNNGLPSGVITDLDGQSGAQAWQYATSGYSSISFGAVGLDGSVYAIETDIQTGDNSGNSYSYLNSFNGVSGGLQARIQLPESLYYFHCPIETRSQYSPAGIGTPAVAPDGSFYIEVASSQSFFESNCENGPEPFGFSTSSSNLSLMRVSPDGGVGFSGLDSSSVLSFTPGDVIPDGQGGVLAAWLKPSGTAILADVGSGAQTTSPIQVESMVLGDNNTAFATNGYNVVALSVPSLAPIWTYTSTGGGLSFVTATSGGGVSLEDSLLGLIQVDANGSPSPPVSGFSNWGPWALGMWPMISNEVLAFVIGPNVEAALSGYPQSAGSGTLNRQYKRPTVDTFLPAPSSDYGFPLYSTLTRGIRATVPTKLANHTIYTGSRATVTGFINELAKPLAIVGFIGHSFDIATNPVSSVGLAFTVAGTALVRDPGDPPAYVITGSGLTPTLVQQITTQAKVVFVGSCYSGLVFQNLWNINQNTKGQVLIVPLNPSQEVLLGQAYNAWLKFLSDMVIGNMTAQAAVQDTNTYLAGIGISQSYTWIGDGTVQLK